MKTTEMRLGSKQQFMLDFLKKYTKQPNQLFSINPSENKVALSLEKKGLIHVVNCGMATNRGTPVYLISLLCDT